MDPKASNYDPLAERYGECVYNTPILPPVPEPSVEYGKVKVKVTLTLEPMFFTLKKIIKTIKTGILSSKYLSFICPALSWLIRP